MNPPFEPTIISTKRLKISTLRPFHMNARTHDLPTIVRSLERLGQYRRVVVNVGTHTGRPYEVLAGNGTMEAAGELGWTQLDCDLVDVDDDTAATIVLVDNRANDKAGYDSAQLAALLQSVPDLDATGYDVADLTRMLNGLEEGDQGGLTDPDAVPSTPKVPVTVAGDVWILGPHRLVCGDASSIDTLRAVTADVTVEACWTDPPYGVDYVGKTADAMTIQGDTTGDTLTQLLHDAFTAALTVLRPGAPTYCATPPGPLQFDFQAALTNAGYLVRQNLIWVKNAMVLGRSDYHYRHEPVLEASAVGLSPVDNDAPDVDPSAEDVTHETIAYGFTPGGSGRLGRGGPRWFGDNKKTTVFEIAKPKASRDHPTMKPVELIVAQLRNSVARGERVLDMFAGSGSTLLAAHQLNLAARLVEIDPRYCDVICRRYQEHTGIQPILEATGLAHDFVPATGE